MYSLTQTGIHWIHPLQNNQPIIKVQCKCNRSILQEETFTCLNCSSYSCHYCTLPQFSTYQCRSCKRISENTVKTSKCVFCFSCPYCYNVLTLSKDPKTKYWIYLCQFCYWNTKQINMKEERAEVLQDNLFKLSGLREYENRIYNVSQSFFKENNIAIEMENQTYKYTNNRRASIRSSMEQSSSKDKQQLKKITQGVETIIKHVGLEQESEEYMGTEQKYPQPLPLLTKKNRRCPQCSKALTNIYRPVVSGETSVQLMHKQIKIVQCQRLQPIDGKVKLKFLKNCILNGKQYKINQIQQIEVEKPFQILANIDNKKKNIEVPYKLKVEVYEKKK